MMEPMVAMGTARLPSGTVTFVLTDVEGSSRLWETHPNEAAAAITRHRDILAKAIDRQGGAQPLEQGEGDSVVGAFGRATDAVRAAHEAQAALADEVWPDGVALRVRMALHSGEATPSDDGTYSSAVLNRCARLRALAHGGQVVVSQATRDLVIDHLDEEIRLQDLGVHRLRDLSRPERIWQIVAPDLEAQFSPLQSLDASPNNLPLQLSSFVGRDDDIALCAALLNEARLLTLTGSGGCGKTRLSLRVAAEVSDRFGDGVWWVELAPLADGSLIPVTVATAMGVRLPVGWEPLPAVLEHLESQGALVVLDNCEHVIADAAAFVDRLLRVAPDVKVLATSREPLAVEGEVTWRVPSLPVPPVEIAEPDRLSQYDAVRLFIDRALQVRPNFAVNNANAPAVAEICQRLDGIPLAIELAAARTRMLSPEQIAAELDNRFRLLAGGTRSALPRHQTLLASIDWSHDLLHADEQALLRRLGVFSDGYTLDAVEAVATAPPLDQLAVLDVLGQLVAKSLVQVDEPPAGGHGRYRLLETIRHYALDRLDEAGEQTTIRDRHLAWAVELAEALEPAATNAQASALDRLEAEHDNMRAALEWANASGQHEPLLRLIAALGLSWSQRGHSAEAQRWIAALPADAANENAALVARAWCMAAYVSWHDHDLANAHQLAAAALNEARRGNDRRTEARSLQTMAMALVMADPAASQALATDATDLAREVGDQWCEAYSLLVGGFARFFQGRLDDADETLDLGFRLVELLDNDLQRAWYGVCQGQVAMLRAQFSASENTMRSATEAARRAGSPIVELWAVLCLTQNTVWSGRPEEAPRVAHEVLTHSRQWGVLGDHVIPVIQALTTLSSAADAAARLESSADAMFAVSNNVTATLVAWAAAIAALEADDAESAARIANRALGTAATSELWSLPGLELALGRQAMVRGDHAAAEGHAHTALSYQTERGMRLWLADAVELLGRAAIAADSWAEGCRLLAAGHAFRASINQPRLPSAAAQVDTSLALARAMLGDEFERAWAEGTALSIDEAAAYARRARGERKRPSFGWNSLTPTENEVVRLVAQGLANPAIGEQMFITSGTVKTHLKHIFTKLGVNSRAQLAAEAAKRQPHGESVAP